MTDAERLVAALVVAEGEPIGVAAASYFDVVATRFALELALADGDPVLRRQLHAELLAEVGPARYAEAIHLALLVI